MNQEKKQQLAITSIPMQQWATVYEPAKGLYIGTIFPELDLPFFMASDPYPGPCQPPDERSAMLQAIDSVSFTIYDLILYLDTHENCQEGKKLYQEKVSLRDKLLKDFANAYYPLVQNVVSDNEDGTQYYNWCAGPMPWEGGC